MSDRYKKANVLHLLIQSEEERLRRKQDFAATVLLVCVIAIGVILLTFTAVKIVDHLREARVGQASGRAGELTPTRPYHFS